MKKQNTKELKKFILKIGIFCLPILIILGFPLFVLIYSKEILPIDKIIEAQTSLPEKQLVSLAYSNPDKYYKLKSTISITPEVLVLGTSRTMQFREWFFVPNIRFFNAGGGISTIKHSNLFLNRLLTERVHPKIIIIGLDQYFFNQNWINANTEINSSSEKSLFRKTCLSEIINNQNITKIYLDYLQHKFTISQLLVKNKEINKIGLNALVNNNGFRKDGSFLYGWTVNNANLPENPDYQFKDTKTRILKGERRFEYGQNISEESIKDLEIFLRKCKKEGIYVIGFLPPYAPSIINQMKNMQNKYMYIKLLPKPLNKLFLKHGFAFYDFSDVSNLKITDKEFIDGFHGSEVVYLKMFLSIIRRNSILAKYTDLPALEKILNKNINPLLFFK
ncbi:MAG: DUF1574 family protein [Candidatus Saganbacteria bacterium]|nr:DUF1574 family protein [Candidatus Saganbacteria bacterium]